MRLRSVDRVDPARGDPARTASSDPVLVARCLDGDDAAWHELIARYGRLVEAVVRRYHLPEDDRADVFQDVWVALWRDLAAVRKQDRLGPWLVTVAGRLAWDARKRRVREVNGESVELLLDGLVDESADPAHEAERSETTDRVRAALMRISPRSRRLIEALFFDRTASYVEIAAELGCSPNSIGPIRGRCFKELRDALVDR
jgi:RNA polymerase sigma factor (sigma-70 family)